MGGWPLPAWQEGWVSWMAVLALPGTSSSGPAPAQHAGRASATRTHGLQPWPSSSALPRALLHSPCPLPWPKAAGQGWVGEAGNMDRRMGEGSLISRLLMSRLQWRWWHWDRVLADLVLSPSLIRRASILGSDDAGFASLVLLPGGVTPARGNSSGEGWHLHFTIATTRWPRG